MSLDPIFLDTKKLPLDGSLPRLSVLIGADLTNSYPSPKGRFEVTLDGHTILTHFFDPTLGGKAMRIEHTNILLFGETLTLRVYPSGGNARLLWGRFLY